jgi:TrmH family RNA methyltransferase
MPNIADWLRSQNISIYTARVEGANDYTRIAFADRAALVVGNEAMGLGARWADDCYQAVRIPMHGMIDSLNASVSTAVVLFEMVRQRTV